MKILSIEGTNNKAKVSICDNINTLFSYDTKVAEYNERTKEMQVFGYHSATTGRHLNAFFALFGLPKLSKKEMIQKYNLDK
jgi:hypothetical protein